MGPLRLTLTLSLVCCAAGCHEEPLDSEVVAAFQDFVDAVRKSDGGRLYDEGPADLRARLDDLFKEHQALVVRVQKQAPRRERSAIQKHLLAETFAGLEGGRDLLGRLLDADRAKATESMQVGLQPRAVTVNGDRATLTTRAKETFRFVREDGRWRCTALLEQLDRYASLKLLRENMKNAEANLEIWGKALRETTDARRPEGAANRVIQYVNRGLRDNLYKMLGSRSQAHLEAGAKIADTLLKELETRLPTPAARRGYLVERKIGWLERVKDARTLFSEMWDAGVLRSELTVGTQTVVGDITSKAPDLVLVQLKSPERTQAVRFRKAEDGTWALAALEPALQRLAVQQLRVELKQLRTTVQPKPAEPPK